VNRGWYSGVVGCVNANGDGNLVVSIRSGVIRGQRAVLFAGSGIVSGSDPNREFEETDWKMATMMDALAVREPE
jgi:isochorismate synthase EntC